MLRCAEDLVLKLQRPGARGLAAWVRDMKIATSYCKAATT
jgi:hypothetical protein